MEFPVHIDGTVVYQAYGENGRCLYVGITDNFYRRMAQHSQKSPWWRHAVRLEVEQHPTRHKAQVREATLIRTLAPPFNTQHQGPAMARKLAAIKARKECRNGRYGCNQWTTDESGYCESCLDPTWVYAEYTPRRVLEEAAARRR